MGGAILVSEEFCVTKRGEITKNPARPASGSCHLFINFANLIVESNMDDYIPDSREIL